MDREAVLAFVHRDWEAVHASKTAYWAERFRVEGWRPAWLAADALWRNMRRVRPDFPDVGERDADLAAHLKLRATFGRAAGAFRSR